MTTTLTFDVKVTRLNIPPCTWVRATQNVKNLLKITEFRDPKTKSYVKRFRAYQEWKIDISAEAKQHGINLEAFGTAIYFFIGMPKTWRKWQRTGKQFAEHTSKPDLSNLLKAFEDGIMPSRDQVISKYSGLGKFWVDMPPEEGWIEVHTGLPYYDAKKNMYLNTSDVVVPEFQPKFLFDNANAKLYETGPDTKIKDKISASEFQHLIKEKKIRLK